MSQRYVKAMKREERRVLKAHLAGFADHLREKPKLMPQWFWAWMQSKVLRMDKIDPMHVARGKI